MIGVAASRGHFSKKMLQLTKESVETKVEIDEEDLKKTQI
jgi:hypothetical protein